MSDFAAVLTSLSSITEWSSSCGWLTFQLKPSKLAKQSREQNPFLEMKSNSSPLTLTRSSITYGKRLVEFTRLIYIASSKARIADIWALLDSATLTAQILESDVMASNTALISKHREQTSVARFSNF